MNEKTKFLIDSLVERMVVWAMQDYNLSLQEAFSLVYNSQLYEKIMDLETGLYYQSSRYNYNLLCREISLGKIA